MRRGVAAASIAGLLALAAPTTPSDAGQVDVPPRDSWESDPKAQPDMGQCTLLAADRLVPVAAPQRPTAISILRSAAIYPLSGVETAALTGGQAVVPPETHPYLVRAVAKNENSGAFEARVCGQTLWISHGSLGHVVPPSTRTPLVVFLGDPPTSLFVSWSMAQ
jgi:hypothetical protein